MNGAGGRTQYFTEDGTPRFVQFLEIVDVVLNIAQSGLVIALLVILIVEDDLTYEFEDDSLVYYGWVFVGVPVAVKTLGILADFGQRFDTIQLDSELVNNDSDSILRVPYMIFGNGAKKGFVTFSQAVAVTLIASVVAAAWIVVLIHSVIEVVVKRSNFYLYVMLGLMAVLSFGSLPESNRIYMYSRTSVWPWRLASWRVLLGLFAVPAVAIVAVVFVEEL